MKNARLELFEFLSIRVKIRNKPKLKNDIWTKKPNFKRFKGPYFYAIKQ